ncbi:MAG: substrate-binding domain-containing protein [Nitrospiraceae bacterium]
MKSEACDIGIIALSPAVVPAMKSKRTYWEISEDAHPPLQQSAVIVKSSKQQKSAALFLAFIKGVQGQEIMKRYGE